MPGRSLKFLDDVLVLAVVHPFSKPALQPANGLGLLEQAQFVDLTTRRMPPARAIANQCAKESLHYRAMMDNCVAVALPSAWLASHKATIEPCSHH
jgi:hypothetical protein